MTEFLSTRLTDQHDTAAFASGNTQLDQWLNGQALRAQHAGICRVVVWTYATEPRRVIAYYTLAPTQVVSLDAHLSRTFAAGYPVVPAWLLGRLAVDHTASGSGVGSQVVLDAIETVISVADRAGGRLIVVDPIDNAAAHWWARRGFTSFGPAQVDGRPSRCYMRIDRALATVTGA
jgi:GNAT superfamily N-acetyltransferase